MNEEGTPDQDGIGQGGLETEATGPGITPGPFAELVGQQPAIAQLSAALQRPVPAYLFVGQTGWGTRRAADIFAGELLARHDPETADRHRRSRTRRSPSSNAPAQRSASRRPAISPAGPSWHRRRAPTRCWSSSTFIWSATLHRRC